MAYAPPHARKKQGGSARSHGKSLSDLMEQNGGRRTNSGSGWRRRDKQLLVESTDFQNNVHALICQKYKDKTIISYKVHAPNCSCNPISKLRKRHSRGVDGSSLDANNPFNNLVVVPLKADQTPVFYICEKTTEQSFQNDATSCEEKLARELFGDDAPRTRFSAGGANTRPFEVTCAQCLLMRNQKNGFVAIVSQSFDVIQAYIQQGREAAVIKARGKKLDPCHYHFIAALQLSTLQSLLLSAGEERDQAKEGILKEMANGDVELSKEMISAFQSKALASAYPDGLERNVLLSMRASPHDVTFNIGHHLKYILIRSLSGQDQEKYFGASYRQKFLGSLPQDLSVKFRKYIMVAGFIDDKSTFELDLPGGKRYLGESTLDNVIRRLEEECSLQVDAWMSNRMPAGLGGLLTEKEEMKDEGVAVVNPGGKNAHNLFYVMSPPLKKID